MSTVKRNSVRKSFAPGSQPPPSTTRRSSAYNRSSTGGSIGQSFFSTTNKSVQKDPRPLKNAQFKQKMQSEITDYLLENGFEMDMKHQLAQNALQSPTQKDFYMIFQWLYMRLDQNYMFSSGKPETEVLPLLTNLKYPYVATITRTQLTAVGSQNTWPAMLGMLHWLMELAKVTDQYQSGYYDQFAEEEGYPIGTDRIVFKYIAKCYNAWLSEIDDHEEFEREMVEAFDERDAGYIDELERLQDMNKQYKEELAELEMSMQPLKKANEERQVLEGDLLRFGEYVEKLEVKMKRHEEHINKIKEEVEGSKQDLLESEKLKASLQKQVDAQGLTPQDIDRMNTERGKLNQGLQQVKAKSDEVQQKLDEHEHNAQSKLEQLERAVSRYNQLAYQIGLTPATAPRAKGKEFELTILPLQDLDGDGKLLLDQRTGYLPSQVLGRDLRHDIKPFLEDLRRETGVDIHNIMDDSTKHSEYIDRIAEALADKRDELETLSVKVQSANNEYQELKETMQEEINMSNAEMEKQAAGLKQMRVGMNKGLLEAEQRFQRTGIEYDEFTQAFIHQREKLHGETKKIVDETIDFKVYIQKQLEDFELLAEKAIDEDGQMEL